MGISKGGSFQIPEDVSTGRSARLPSGANLGCRGKSGSSICRTTNGDGQRSSKASSNSAAAPGENAQLKVPNVLEFPVRVLAGERQNVRPS